MLVNLLTEAVFQTPGVLTLACVFKWAFTVPLKISLGAAKQQQLHWSSSSTVLLARVHACGTALVSLQQRPALSL